MILVGDDDGRSWRSGCHLHQPIIGHVDLPVVGDRKRLLTRKLNLNFIKFAQIQLLVVWISILWTILPSSLVNLNTCFSPLLTNRKGFLSVSSLMPSVSSGMLTTVWSSLCNESISTVIASLRNKLEAVMSILKFNFYEYLNFYCTYRTKAVCQSSGRQVSIPWCQFRPVFDPYLGRNISMWFQHRKRDRWTIRTCRWWGHAAANRGSHTLGWAKWTNQIQLIINSIKSRYSRSIPSFSKNQKLVTFNAAVNFILKQKCYEE